MRPIRLTLILLVLGVLAVPASAGADGTALTTIFRTPIDGMTSTSCSTPEPVSFSGQYQSVFHYTLDGSGVAHFSGAVTSSGVGTGLVTGTSYRFAGASSSSTNEAPNGFPYHNTFTNTFLLVSHGPGDNLLMHATTHVTIDANGTLTAEVTNTTFECVG